MDNKSLVDYKNEVEQELHQLLNWWRKHAVDEQYGGFYGKIDPENIPTKDAEKGLVLNARILYTFSSAYALTEKKEYLLTAVRAFDYFINHFIDPVNGGFYWSVDAQGNKLDGKKQVYGQAFAIYGCIAYYKITKNDKALELARHTFGLLEKYSFDQIHTGYIEALSQSWQPIADLRLSDKDQNEKKSMNTHLHVIEAYATLYTVWKDESLKAAIKTLLINFRQHIINSENHHLHLFFAENWEVKSTVVSFGHDIEAAWLLQEAAAVIGDEEEIETFRQIALAMANATKKGIDPNGGLWYEYDPQTAHWNREFHWWPQAEAMVGFFNAAQLNGDEMYFAQSLKSWGFIKTHLKDTQNGEWFWGVNGDYSLMENQDKAGFWKCPYHNGRACIELITRINSLTD